MILLQVDPEQLQVLAGEMEKGDRNFDYMYTFGAYNDGVTLQANPLQVWKFYRDGSQVNGT